MYIEATEFTEYPCNFWDNRAHPYGDTALVVDNRVIYAPNDPIARHSILMLAVVLKDAASPGEAILDLPLTSASVAFYLKHYPELFGRALAELGCVDLSPENICKYIASFKYDTCASEKRGRGRPRKVHAYGVQQITTDSPVESVETKADGSMIAPDEASLVHGILKDLVSN